MKNCLIFVFSAQAIVIISLIAFIVPSTITSDLGDHATWSGSIISFFTMIFTAAIGFYAYTIAKEQNKSSQISYMTEMLRALANQSNEAVKLAHCKMKSPSEADEYPNIEKCLSDLTTAIIKASEIINKLHPNDFDLYRNMFYSMIDSSVSTEIMEKNILTDHKSAMMGEISNSYDRAKRMVEPFKK
ncbi:hypothetical protein [Acetobacter senegalensis]|uniref:hypothetical protein n=1 Tax=Acetobacter senegalensis TaxID=446692 RepID=UPI000A842A90|nr:hypothetical protein [Acetobacter senegalensis]